MLLCNTHIVDSVREALFETSQTSTTRHGCMYGNDAGIAIGFGNERVSEIVRVTHGFHFRLHLLSGFRVKANDTMHFVRGSFSGNVTSAFFREDVDEHGPLGVGQTDVIKNCDEVVNVMAVHRSDVVQTELLEEGRSRSRNEAAGVLVQLGRRTLYGRRELLSKALGHLTEFAKRAVSLEPGQSGRKTTHGILVFAVVLGGERHLLVVIEDNNHVLVQETSVVHGLVRHASCDSTIANHRNDTILATTGITAHGHTQACGNGS
mmetsp:Transcript_4392/g.7838  ORF Transcript_4392/g.7838 Transcript_4392/m.7838 type:complete len:263 (-) Transcript_4392:729-1517(-)